MLVESIIIPFKEIIGIIQEPSKKSVLFDVIKIKTNEKEVNYLLFFSNY